MVQLITDRILLIERNRPAHIEIKDLGFKDIVIFCS